MLLKGNQLIGTKVTTKSGLFLGKVKGFIINTNDLKINQIIVTKDKILDKILAKELIISRDQIIEITDQKMIVDDNIITDTETVKQTVTA